MKNKEFEEFIIEKEVLKSKRDRFISFEHDLRYLLNNCSNVTTSDWIALSQIKQSILTLALADKFCNKNDAILLSNCRYEIDTFLNDLEANHPNINTCIIRLFIQDFLEN